MLDSAGIGAFSNTNIQQPQTLPTHSLILCGNSQFRISMNQFQCKEHLLYYVCFAWVVFGFGGAILILSHSLDLQPSPALVIIAIGFIPLNIFAIYKRKKFKNGFVFSSILFNILTITFAILLPLNIRFCGISFGVYMFVQFVKSFILDENKGKLLFKVFIFIQIEAICLKIDNIIQLQWKQVTFGMIILFFLLLLAATSILTFSFFVSGWRFHQNNFEIKAIGLRFISSNLLSFSMIISIFIWGIFINSQYHIPAIFGIFSFLSTSIFTFLKRTEIGLFLCESVQLISKQQTQLIFQNIKTKKLGRLYRLSQNWFTRLYDSNTCQKDLQVEECVICMDSQAQAVWMPCGHCTLCNICMNELITKKTVDCPLCKSKPSEILTISKKNHFPASILRKNEFQVQKGVTVKYV